MNMRADVMGLGPYSISLRNHVLTNASGHEIALEPRALSVLAILIENEGSFVALETLRDRVWGEVLVTDDSIYRCIHQLRCVLRELEHMPYQIVTKRGIGYRLEGLADSVDSKHDSKSPVPPRVRSPGTHWNRTSGTVAFAGALVVGFAYFLTLNLNDPAESISETTDIILADAISTSLLNLSFFDEDQVFPEQFIEGVSIESADSIINAIAVLKPEFEWNLDRKASDD
jgi:DNA-binding winged helix-turn-helix (wHTH) protein